MNPNRKWAFEIKVPFGQDDAIITSYYSASYIQVRYPGIVFDGSSAQSATGLSRDSNENRPKVIISGINRINARSQGKWGYARKGIYVLEAAHHFAIKGVGVVEFPEQGLLIKGKSPYIEDGYFCDNQQQGIYIDETATSATIGSETPDAYPVVVSRNKGTAGIVVRSERTTIFNVRVGTDHTGVQAEPNLGIGILVDKSATGFVLGSTYPAVPTIVSGNVKYGVMLSGGLGSRVFGAIIGCGIDGKTEIPNEFGIYINSAPFDSGISDRAALASLKLDSLTVSTERVASIVGSMDATTIVSGNTKYGIYSNALNTRIVGETFVGLAKDGVSKVPNRDGVYIAGKSSYIGPGVVVSGNSVRGIYVSAEGVLVEDVRVGVSQDGQKAVGNGADGLFVAESALAGVVVKGGIYSGNSRSGIFADSANLEILGSILGLAGDGRTAIGNGRYGLEIGEFAKGVVVGPFRTSNVCSLVNNAKTIAGRYVRITIGQATYINLQEVEAFGLNSATRLVPSSASFKETYKTNEAKFCIDGDKEGPICQSNSGLGQWLQIDFGRTVEIARIVITNRADCCQDRVERSAVTISNDKDATDPTWQGTVQSASMAEYTLGVGCTDTADLVEADRTTVTVSGNGLGGILTGAPEVHLCNVQVGLTVDGTDIAPNLKNGITVGASGKGTTIGHAVADMCTSTVAGNTGDGIRVEGDLVGINNVGVGTTPRVDGQEQIFGGKFGNLNHGIYTTSDSHVAGIVDSTISGNGGTGIYVEGHQTIINGNVVGQGNSLGSEASGNKEGIHVTLMSEKTEIGTQPYFTNLIGCNRIQFSGSRYQELNTMYTLKRHRIVGKLPTYWTPNGNYFMFRCRTISDDMMVINHKDFFNDAQVNAGAACNGWAYTNARHNNVELTEAVWYTWHNNVWEQQRGARTRPDCVVPNLANYIAANNLAGIRDDKSPDDLDKHDGKNTIISDSDETRQEIILR